LHIEFSILDTGRRALHFLIRVGKGFSFRNLYSVTQLLFSYSRALPRVSRPHNASVSSAIEIGRGASLFPQRQIEIAQECAAARKHHAPVHRCLRPDRAAWLPAPSHRFADLRTGSGQLVQLALGSVRFSLGITVQKKSRRGVSDPTRTARSSPLIVGSARARRHQIRSWMRLLPSASPQKVCCWRLR